jgi:hypothetical protein
MLPVKRVFPPVKTQGKNFNRCAMGIDKNVTAAMVTESRHHGVMKFGLYCLNLNLSD